MTCGSNSTRFNAGKCTQHGAGHVGISSYYFSYGISNCPPNHAGEGAFIPRCGNVPLFTDAESEESGELFRVMLGVNHRAWVQRQVLGVPGPTRLIIARSPSPPTPLVTLAPSCLLLCPTPHPYPPTVPLSEHLRIAGEHPSPWVTGFASNSWPQASTDTQDCQKFYYNSLVNPISLS